jgi:hypothetical protein
MATYSVSRNGRGRIVVSFPCPSSTLLRKCCLHLSVSHALSKRMLLSSHFCSWVSNLILYSNIDHHANYASVVPIVSSVWLCLHFIILVHIIVIHVFISLSSSLFIWLPLNERQHNSVGNLYEDKHNVRRFNSMSFKMKIHSASLLPFNSSGSAEPVTWHPSSGPQPGGGSDSLSLRVNGDPCTQDPAAKPAYSNGKRSLLATCISAVLRLEGPRPPVEGDSPQHRSALRRGLSRG